MDRVRSDSFASQNLEAGVSCACIPSWISVICNGHMQYFIAMSQLHLCITEGYWWLRSNVQHWETCVSYCDYPCDLVIPPPHCFTALHSTLHNLVRPLQITEIQLGVHVQLNFSCLYEGHTGWAADGVPSFGAVLWEQCMHYFMVMDKFLQKFKYNNLCYSTLSNQRAVIWLWITEVPCFQLTIVSYV